MGFPEHRSSLTEPETIFTDAGPHAVGATFGVEATFTGRIECVLLVKDDAAEVLRLSVVFVVLMQNGAIIHAKPIDVEWTHAAWTVATAATPPELSISDGEVFATFVGIVGASVHATLSARGIKT